jgi:hypothetical protein
VVATVAAVVEVNVVSALRMVMQQLLFLLLHQQVHLQALQ